MPVTNVHAAIWVVASFMLLFAARSDAADLKPETLQAWQQYVDAANTRNQEHLAPGNSFLSIHEMPGCDAKLKAGQILVRPADPHVPVKVPSGLIHDWLGAAFIPDVTIPDVMHVVRDYPSYKDVYHPNVIASSGITKADSEDRFSLRLMNRVVIAHIALDGVYDSRYVRVDDRHWYSITKSTEIRELADYGSPSEHMMPENHSSGLLWRLYTIARFEERDGGVYVEVEAVALSRDIPFSLRWLVDPIVRRISRSSLLTSLQQTEKAVRSGPAVAKRPANPASERDASLIKSWR